MGGDELDSDEEDSDDDAEEIDLLPIFKNVTLLVISSAASETWHNFSYHNRLIDIARVNAWFTPKLNMTVKVSPPPPEDSTLYIDVRTVAHSRSLIAGVKLVWYSRT